MLAIKLWPGNPLVSSDAENYDWKRRFHGGIIVIVTK